MGFCYIDGFHMQLFTRDYAFTSNLGEFQVLTTAISLKFSCEILEKFMNECV
eukprot:c31858_g1_i1 orf=113-268(+)